MTASYTEQHAQPEPLRLPDPALLFEGRAARLSKLILDHVGRAFIAAWIASSTWHASPA